MITGPMILGAIIVLMGVVTLLYSLVSVASRADDELLGDDQYDDDSGDKK